MSAVEQVIDDYIAEYELTGESDSGAEVTHTPTGFEQYLIKDAIMGLISTSEWQAALSQSAPQGMTELLGLIERYGILSADVQIRRGITKEWSKAHDALLRAITTLVQENVSLKVRVAELEVDVARIDWLDAQINEHGAIHLHDGAYSHGHGLGLRPGSMVRTLREAIDIAKGAK